MLQDDDLSDAENFTSVDGGVSGDKTMFEWAARGQKVEFVVVLSCFFAVVAAAPQVKEEPIAIVAYSNDPKPDGGYQWSYETANGIKADETGTLVKSNDPENGEVVEAEGGYSYTGPEGVPVNIRYIATANGGFVATGDAIPVAPPIPEAIQKALDYLATLPSTTEGNGRR
uniref:Uncharacterized protein n=2 Tax=Timema TaxID=61471 RepID=A0A7R9CM84_TIMPO|nr:unnamed protein product [Timema douglasi]CAD7397643.1 unnamed protein product [Timema poppensis]